MMIFVTGATGTIGNLLLRELIGQNQEIAALVRTEEQARHVKELGASVIVGDLNEPSSYKPTLAQCEIAFVLTAATPNQVEQENNLVASAVAVGTSLVYLSVLGAAPNSKSRIARNHGETQQVLAQSDVNYTVLQPGSFMQNLLNSTYSVRTANVIAAPAADAAISMIDARDIAASVAAVLINPLRHVNQTYQLTGSEAVTYAQVASQLSAVLGKQINYNDITSDEALQSYLSNGISQWLAEAIIEIYDASREGYASLVTGDVDKLIGRAPRSVETFLSDYADSFK